MSRYSNPATPDWVHRGRGQRGRVRELKRREAEARNDSTPVERTARFRRDRATVQAAVAAARTHRATVPTSSVDHPGVTR